MKRKLDSFFKISERGSSVKTEVIGGLTTFFATAYIVVTNPNQITGFKTFGEFGTIWNAVYVASILTAVIGTLLYAFYANLPYAQACGMGLNSFFFVSFILPAFDSGTSTIKGYKEGLCIILISGFIFLILSLTGAREKIAKAMPDCLKQSISAGIGLFIAFIGFQNVDMIQPNEYTLLQFFDFHKAIAGLSPFDAWKAVAPVILTLVGLCLIGVLDRKNINGGIMIVIGTITALYYLTTWQIPSFDFAQVKQSFIDFSDIGLLGAFDGFTIFEGGAGNIINALLLTLTFCLVDMFDTIGTIYGVAAQSGMMDENGDPINMDKSMASDSIATVAGGLLGTSTCTTVVESAASIAVGARTGLSSLVTAACMFICLFLTPVAAIVPACATAPALIYVGVLMLKNFANVNMKEVEAAVPAFLALVMMPLTYSISNGIGVGAIAYTIITIFSGKYTKKDIAITVVSILFLIRFFLVSY